MWDDLAVTLNGTRVVLEPLAQRHADGLRAAAADARVSAWLPVKLDQPDGFGWWLADGLDAWPAVSANLERRLAALSS